MNLHTNLKGLHLHSLCGAQVSPSLCYVETCLNIVYRSDLCLCRGSVPTPLQILGSRFKCPLNTKKACKNWVAHFYVTKWGGFPVSQA